MENRFFAKHPREMNSIEEIDVDYYVHNQLLSVALRIVGYFGVKPDELVSGGRTLALSELI